jgi:hypothetical protein
MKRITPIREPQVNVLETVEDPKHRLDVAAYKVVEEISKRDPVLEAVFANVKGPLADFLNEKLGPEPSKKPRRVRRKRRAS